ncbi:MAG: hypothetical protein JO359_02140, partial [Candidatus Eremiobacteraeota bacterium]|nr:hypothetical protein [Candidatus Eremiobacteraeota bacterium]
MMQTKTESERWDLSAFFASLADDRYVAYTRTLESRIEALGSRAAELGPLDVRGLDLWVETLLEAEDLEACIHHVESFVQGMVTTDESDAVARAEESRASVRRGALNKAELRLNALLAEATDAAFAALCADSRMANAGWHLQSKRREARTLLTPAEEQLAADLLVDSFHRWGQTAQAVASQLQFHMRWPSGKTERLPMSYRYDLLWDAEPKVRRAAFEGINDVARANETVFAASLNGIAGTRLTLARRRGRDVVDDAIEKNGMEPVTVETMMQVLHGQRGRLYRYLGMKARMLGLDSMGIYDRSAPLQVPELAPVDLATAKQQVLA